MWHSIFWRLILSHLGILLLSGAACLYSIVQLDSLSGTARSALDNDHRLIDYQESLTDAFLSQVRYGGKYLITHVAGPYEQMQQFKMDFTGYLELLRKLGQTEQANASVTKIERLHGQYHELFDREVEYIRARQNYAQSRYQQERDKIVESMLNELDRLKAHLRSKLQAKLAVMEQGARTAQRIAILTTLVVLVFGVFLSLKISKDLSAAAGESPAVKPSIATVPLQSIREALRMIHRSKDWLDHHLRRLPSTLWKGPSTRKGG